MAKDLCKKEHCWVIRQGKVICGDCGKVYLINGKIVKSDIDDFGKVN